MIIVAYLFNWNGMASWCWEAAHALHEVGQSVLLICSEEVMLPGTPILIAAVNLEEPRKRVKWMIGVLKNSNYRNFSISLVGDASKKFRKWVCRNNFPATFLGRIPREKLQNLMSDHDVFLFGSCLDDWVTS